MEINKIIKYGEKFGDITLIFKRELKEEIIYTNKRPSKFMAGEDVYLGIRISKGKKFGYSSTNNLKNWKNAVENAAKIMKLSRELEINVPILKKKKMPSVKGIYSKKVEGLSKDEIYSLCKNFVNVEFNVPNASIKKTINERKIANSNGINLTEKQTSFEAYIEVNEKDVNTYEYHISHNLFDPHYFGEKASALLRSKLNPKKIKKFRGSVVFDYFAISNIIESVLIPSILADNVQSKRSVFYDKIGEKVISECITIYDDGLLQNGIFTSKFDGEGEKRQRTVVFKNGVLKNFLYDNFSAIKDCVKSTGNSEGIDSLPNIGPTNFLIKKGRYSKEKLLSNVKEGLYVRDISGTHLVNKITGDFSVGGDDVFYIKNGEILYPVKQLVMNFNLFNSLKNVIIGKEYRQESNVVSPPILFEDVLIIT